MTDPGLGLALPKLPIPRAGWAPILIPVPLGVRAIPAAPPAHPWGRNKPWVGQGMLEGPRQPHHPCTAGTAPSPPKDKHLEQGPQRGNFPLHTGRAVSGSCTGCACVKGSV